MDDLYARALEGAAGRSATAEAISQVSHATSSEAARWAFAQWELRRRGAAKFDRANEMLFDRDGLEMASHPAVAAYHASKFPSGEAVVEIGCGIGSDTIALGLRGPVFACEVDVARADLARHNLQVHGIEAKVSVADGLANNDQQTYVYCDPARRNSSNRRLRLDDLEPSPFDVLASFPATKLIGIKLSPMTPDFELERLAAGRPHWIEFLSFGRECRECLFWLGESVHGSEVRAVRIEDGSIVRKQPAPMTVEDPLSMIFEADPAAIRANALGSFGLLGLGDSNGFLTADEPNNSPWLRSYRVLYHGKGDLKATRAALRKEEAGRIIVKQRGIGQDPAVVAKQLAGSGPNERIVLMWKVGASVRHAIVDPV